MANRNRGYYREMRKKAIKRKKHIINSYRQDNPPAFIDAKCSGPELYKLDNSREFGCCDPYWFVEHDGMLSKGKIHCSCGMCSFHRINRQDIKKFYEMESDLLDEKDFIPSDVLSPLCNALRKKSRGNYYPHGGYRGTKITCDKKVNITEFYDLVEESKCDRDLIRNRLITKRYA